MSKTMETDVQERWKTSKVHLINSDGEEITASNYEPQLCSFYLAEGMLSNMSRVVFPEAQERWEDVDRVRFDSGFEAELHRRYTINPGGIFIIRKGDLTISYE